MADRRGAKACGVPVTVAQQQFAWRRWLSRKRVDLALARLESAGRVQSVSQRVL